MAYNLRTGAPLPEFSPEYAHKVRQLRAPTLAEVQQAHDDLDRFMDLYVVEDGPPDQYHQMRGVYAALKWVLGGPSMMHSNLEFIREELAKVPKH